MLSISSSFILRSRAAGDFRRFRSVPFIIHAEIPIEKIPFAYGAIAPGYDWKNRQRLTLSQVLPVGSGFD
jgi:hypothetical protein